jgi:hypothetical protein
MSLDGSPALLKPCRKKAEFVKVFLERVSKGIDPLYVGELVREGIENDSHRKSLRRKPFARRSARKPWRPRCDGGPPAALHGGESCAAVSA